MLSTKLASQIQAIIDEGDVALDADEFATAIQLYQQAVALLPSPRHAHDISLATLTALGEGFFFAGYFQRALEAFKEAQKAPGGIENPLLYLRLGQAYFECGDLDGAADSLVRAYALDGLQVFEDEDEKYLSFLATRIELD
jgi:tetratricopeptide (TPR) repeat protein